MIDAAMAFFRERGYSGSYNDAFRQYLVDLTNNSRGTIEDLLSQWLSSHSGSIPDKVLSFGRTKNYFGAYEDVLRQIWLGGGFADNLWTPAALGADLALWLDADDASTITLNGSTVSQWNDKSPNALHVSQATAGLQPAYSATGILGKPTLDWGTVSNDRVLTRAISGYEPKRYFGVAEWDGPDPFNNFGGLVTHGPSAGITSSDRVMTTASGQGWFGVLQYHLNGGAASAVALPTISSPFVFATNFGPQTGRASIHIGSDIVAGPLRAWLGKISEIIAINFVPTTQDRQLIEGYLAWKWGLTANLPADHPFKNTPPTV